MVNDARPEVAMGEVLVRESGDAYRNEVFMHSHALVVDEPIPMGGNNEGPRPTELLLSALGSCISITLRMYAEHKALPVGRISVHISKAKPEKGVAPQIHVDIQVAGALDESQLKRMRAIAKKCPVHKLLTGELDITHSLELIDQE